MKILGLAVLLCWGAPANVLAGETTARPTGVSENHLASPSEQLELATGPVVERVRRQYAERLAGLYFEPEQQRIVVRLTGSDPVAPESHVAGNATLRVVFRPGAAHTFTELSEVMESSAAKIETAVPNTHGRYVDERTGEIVIGVAPGTIDVAAKRAQLEQALGVPVRLMVEEPAVLQQPAVR